MLYDMILREYNNPIYKVTDLQGIKLYQGLKTDCIAYIRANTKCRLYQDLT